MKLSDKLTKLGIVKKSELNYKEVNYIAHFFADKITSTFLTLQNQYNEILAKVLNCKMYYANVISNIAKVNYIYEENSIYIDENIDILEPNEELFHEIIHYLQTLRQNTGKISKVGLCNFKDFGINGIGINEAVVQYMAAKIMGNNKNKINLYGIRLQTISPCYFPILTNLIEQLIYYLGEDIIIQSAINVNENFEDTFYNTFEEKTNQIIKNFDKILEFRNKLATIDNLKNRQKIEKNIYDTYLQTQELMFFKFYNQAIPRITEQKEIDLYLNKLLNNERYLGIEEKDEFTGINFYEEGKKIIISQLDNQLVKINKQKQKKALLVYNNKIREFLKRAISYLFN